MLLIILLGLIAKLTSVSGECVVGTQNVNINWNKFSGDRLWYYRKHTPGSIDGGFRCLVMQYASPVGNISPITIWGIDVSTQIPITVSGYATNWNSTSWEEIYPQLPFLTGQNYPIAVDYNRYLIYKYCFSGSNEPDVYVAYRIPFPDEDTVKRVKKELNKNDIQYSQLADFSVMNCNFTGSSSEDGDSQ